MMTTSPMNRVVQHLRKTATRQQGADSTDGHLLECFVSRRDAAALECLIQRHGGMVWNVCRRLLTNHHDAEDAFQATFLVLVRRAGAIAPRHMVGNWLYGVARQTALKARATAARRRSRETPMTPMPEPAGSLHTDRDRDVHAALDEELARLPAIYRSAIVLCDLEGRTCRAAARQLDVPDGTLAARLRRGRALLAKRLTGRGFAGCCAALARHAVPASVPSAVMTATIQAATVVATGQTALVSASVATLTEGVMKSMVLAKLKIRLALIVALTIAGIGVAHRLLPASSAGMAETAQPQPLAGEEPKKQRDGFDMRTPAARLQWLQKLKRDKECTAVTRGDVVATVVARGSLESAKPGDVTSTVRPFPKAADYAVIKWVIDDGTQAKKGDVVVQLDDSALKKALEALALELRKAEIALVRAKQDGDNKTARAQQPIVDGLKTRLLDLELQIQACRIVAPQDGMVVYWVPEQRKDAKQLPIVAQGEPVREGQKLLQIPDLSHMQVRVLVPKTQIDQLRAPDPKKKLPPQPAEVRVDAFPNRVLKGHLAAVDTRAQPNEFLLRNKLLYKTLVAIDEGGKLLPGMSAEVTIETGRAMGVLQVPVTAVVTQGAKHYCYIRRPAGIDKVEVKPGVRSTRAVEIKSGLHKGDMVLSNPAVQLRGVP